jgi:hypothetical protein
MNVHQIRDEMILATLGPDSRVSVVEHLARKPQGTAAARIAQILALSAGASIALTHGEWHAAGHPLRFTMTDDEAIAWGLALAALHMMPNRERIWI